MGREMNARETDKYIEVLTGKPEIKELHVYSYVPSCIIRCIHVLPLLHVY